MHTLLWRQRIHLEDSFLKASGFFHLAYKTFGVEGIMYRHCLCQKKEMDSDSGANWDETTGTPLDLERNHSPSTYLAPDMKP